MFLMSINLKKYYKKSFEIIKENKKIIYFVGLIYLLSFIGGFLYYNSTYEGFSSDEVKTSYMEWYKSDVLKDNFFDNFTTIFPHNIIASLFRIISGLLFAVFPIFNVIHGAILDSYVFVSEIKDKTFYLVINGWLPHSLIEIPAHILASSLGVMIFLSIFKSKNKILNIVQAYKDSLIVFVFIILPMMLVAAIIESIIIVNLWF